MDKEHNHGVGCTCGECHDHNHGEENRKLKIAQIVIAAIIYALGMVADNVEVVGEIIPPLYIFLVGYLIVGLPVVYSALKNIFKGNFFDENFLMSLATICAFFVNEYSEAVMVMLLYQVGELLQDMAVDNSHKSIKGLLDMKEIIVHRIASNGEIEDIEIEKANIGDVFLVKPGERIALDGKIVEGETTLDMSPLSGESLPVEKHKDDGVLSGSININGIIKVKVEKVYNESTVNKILECIESATVSKTQSERFVTKFAKIYTPIVVVAAVLLVVIPTILGYPFSDWLYRACTLLVVSCPCALVISIPLTFFIGIGVSSKKGILMKGSNYLELLDKMDTILFDKTGTLTKGKLSISKVVAANQNEIIDTAAIVESYSNHPIAEAIKKSSKEDVAKHKIEDYKEVAGEGIEAKVDGNLIKVGKWAYVSNNSADSSDEIGSIVHVSKNGNYLGYIVVSDTVKDDAALAMTELKSKGIKTVMVSGDNAKNAHSVGDKIGIDQIHSDLLPNQKVEVLDDYLNKRKGEGKVGFVGDGINDAPVIAKSDIGIAMGGLGSEAAIEVSDVVVMNDSLTSLINAKDISKKTVRIVRQNIVMVVVIKVVAMILGAFGELPMWAAVISDVGVCLLAILNSLRLFKYAK